MKELPLELGRIEFDDISEVWDNLWPGQTHKSHSAMKMMGGTDYTIQDWYKWRGWKITQGNSIVGVMAGHKSGKREYRTRGLWVKETHRGKGIANKKIEMGDEILASLGQSVIDNLDNLENDFDYTPDR